MVDEQFIRDRLTRLREERNISERKMSLDLGHSTSYIRGISSGRALPSMTEFIYICEYLNISPMDFFNDKKSVSLVQQKAIDYIYTLPDSDVELIISFIERVKKA